MHSDYDSAESTADSDPEDSRALSSWLPLHFRRTRGIAVVAEDDGSSVTLHCCRARESFLYMIKSKGDSDQDVATRLRGHMPSDGLLPEVLQLDVVGCHGADVSSWASLGIVMRRMVGTRDPSNLN